MFRQANPDSRIPAFLQAYTKENLIWQFKMTVLIVAILEIHDWLVRKEKPSSILIPNEI